MALTFGSSIRSLSGAFSSLAFSSGISFPWAIKDFLTALFCLSSMLVIASRAACSYSAFWASVISLCSAGLGISTLIFIGAGSGVGDSTFTVFFALIISISF